MKKVYGVLILFFISFILIGCKVVPPKVFQVDFETFGGEKVYEKLIEEGGFLEKPNDPSKSGYYFNGWYLDQDFNMLFNFKNDVVDKNMTLYAQFIKIHKINLDAGIGSIEVKFIEVLNNNTFELPNPSAPSGYKFIGWYLGEDKYVDTIATRDLNLVARYEELEQKLIYYKITLDAKEGVLVTKELMVLEDEVFLLPIPLAPDGFKFIGWYNGDVKFVSNKTNVNLDLIAKYEKIDEENNVFVTINLDPVLGILENDTIIVRVDEVFTLPVPSAPIGYRFIGWFDDTDKIFNNNTTKVDLNLIAKYSILSNDMTYEFGSYKEALWFVVDGSFTDVSVEYNLINESRKYTLDNQLIRYKNSQVFIDIVGIKAGYYDVEIVLDGEFTIKVTDILVEAHDRSGYAHFNYDKGVGAYQNDGTLKDDAIVVYVTEENKDTITIPGIGQVGLGWILNNNQYGNNESTTYDPAKYNLSLAKFNKPIVFRLIGKITAPEGVTGYNSKVNGGAIGDNGFMVRMKDAVNITIEGVGDDAIIYGWGIHFMASVKDRGIGFEVRNLTFDRYPEDAIGMEGVQKGGVLTNPVERGFIHNNTFLKGYAENPAESDKGAGDGSLDIKRGQYFTIAYNQFLETQKTNLVGASDSNLQYHITYHHNYWYNVQSRIPLARQANIHMYNNLFYTSDDQRGENSTVQDVRANAFIFSEANYFHATKDSTKVRSGAVKSYGDIKYSNYNNDDATYVKDRTTAVVSGNKYENFDTNKNVFYYDDLNMKSDVTLLTSAFQAKIDVLRLSGSNNKDNLIKVTDQLITSQYKNKPIEQVNASKTIAGGKILKGSPFYIFEIKTNALVTLNDASGKVPAVLVNNYGETMLLGTGSVLLKPGIYIIESSIAHGASKGSSQAKDSAVGSVEITLDSKDQSERRIKAYRDALNKLPSVLEYNQANQKLIKDLNERYNDLTSEDKNNIDIDNYQNINSAFNNLGKNYIENLINNIGVVTKDSYPLIKLAREAYNQATNEIKNIVTNLDDLIDSENAFQIFEIENINKQISDSLTVTNELINDYQLLFETDILYNDLLERYNSLEQEDKHLIVNINKITDGLLIIEEMILAYELKEILNELNSARDDLDEMKFLYENYQVLNNDFKVIFNSSDQTKLDRLFNEYEEIKESQRAELYYFESNNNYFQNVGSKYNGFDIKPSIYYNDIVINRGFKVESTSKLKFETEALHTRIYISFTSGETLKIDGVEHNITNGYLELFIGKGEHFIERGKSEARINYIIVTENY